MTKSWFVEVHIYYSVRPFRPIGELTDHGMWEDTYGVQLVGLES